MPSVDYSLVANNDLSNLQQGFKMGKDIAEYKKNRENELKQKAADIANAEAIAKTNATNAQVVASTAQSKIQQINADNSLDAETKGQALSGLVATRDQNLQIFKDNTDVLSRVASAKKEVGDQIADLTKVNAQVQLGEAQNKAKNLPFEAARQQAQNEVLTGVLDQMKKTGKPVTVDIGGGRQAVYTLTDKGLTSDVLQPVSANKQSYISTRSVQRPGAQAGVMDVLGTTTDGREEVIPSLSAKPGAAGATGVAGQMLDDTGRRRIAPIDDANRVGAPYISPNPTFGSDEKGARVIKGKRYSEDLRLEKLAADAATTSEQLITGLKQFGAIDEGTSPYFTFLPSGTDERNMQAYTEQMTQLMKSPSWTGAVSDWEGKMFQARLPMYNKTPEYNRQAIDVLTAGAERVQDYSRFIGAYKELHGDLEGAQSAWNKYRTEVPTIVDYDTLKKQYGERTGLSGEKLNAGWKVEAKEKGYTDDQLYRNPNYIDSGEYFRAKNLEALQSGGIPESEQQSSGAPAEYKSDEDLKSALQRGDITRERAEKIARDMGFIQ